MANAAPPAATLVRNFRRDKSFFSLMDCSFFAAGIIALSPVHCECKVRWAIRARRCSGLRQAEGLRIALGKSLPCGGHTQQMPRDNRIPRDPQTLRLPPPARTG